MTHTLWTLNPAESLWEAVEEDLRWCSPPPSTENQMKEIFGENDAEGESTPGCTESLYVVFSLSLSPVSLYHRLQRAK